MDLFDLLRTAVSLAAVFGALWYLHRRITKGRPGRPAGARARSIDVVARHGLGAKAGVAVVDVEGTRYLIGVTEHAVNVLDRIGPAPQIEDATGDGAGTAPRPLLERLRPVLRPGTRPSGGGADLAPAVPRSLLERLRQPVATTVMPAAPSAAPVEIAAAPVVAPAPPPVVRPRPVDAFERELDAATRAESAARPAVTTVTAAVVVQRTGPGGTGTVAIVPAAAIPSRSAEPPAALPAGAFPTRRAARAAAEAAAVARGESPQDEFERMLHAVVSADPTLPTAPTERIDAAPITVRGPAEPTASEQGRAGPSAAGFSPGGSPLAGSVLHPDTWRQTVAAIRRLR